MPVSSTATMTSLEPWVRFQAVFAFVPNAPVRPQSVPLVNAVSVGDVGTKPDPSAGLVTTIEVAVFDTMVAEAVPNRTLVIPERFVPVMVTVVPPAVAPAFGETDVIVGAEDVNVKPLARARDPPGPVTLTSTAPMLATRGVLTTTCVDVRDKMVPLVPPNDTSETSAMPVPEIVTDVPPAVPPDDGVSDVMVGGFCMAPARFMPSPSQPSGA